MAPASRSARSRLVHVPERADAVTRRRRRDGGVERGPVPPVPARDDEREVGGGGGDGVERADERGIVLAGLDRADREHVAARARERGARGGIAPGLGADAGIDAHDPFGREPVVRADLGADEVADHMHGRAPSDAELDEAGAEAAGLLVDELGVLHERQVVERDDDRGASRRHPVVGRVDHVDPAGPALDPGAPTALPEGVHVPGRQDRSRDADPGGTRGRHPGARCG